MSHATDPRIDAHIDALPEWQQAMHRLAQDQDSSRLGDRLRRRGKGAGASCSRPKG